MAREIKLPQLGQTMEEGTVVECTVKVGDEVAKGDVIFEIETDKATLEVESPADGFVKYILAETGQTLPVGEPIMVLGDKDEKVPKSFIESLKGGGATTAAAAEPGTTAEQAKPAEKSDEPARTERVKASPRAKKLAEQLGVDLAVVKGSGPGGRITEDDVKEAAGSKPGKAAEPAASAEVRPGATVALNRLQKLTAERMLKSKLEIPCFYLNVKADVTDIVALRAKLNETGDVKLSYNDFIIRAVATGLEKYPIMTGQLDGEVIKLADAIHIGLAIAVPDGLVAPLVKDANKKDIKQIARDSQALVERARGDKLSLEDLEGGCITVSNLGAFGINSFTPIVVPGQCSILGIGQITDTCVPEDGGILIRKLVSMTLSVDHKVANGAYAAQFLDFVRKQLEDVATFGPGS